MIRLRMLGVLAAVLVLSGCGSMERREPVEDFVQMDADVSATVLFFADPQIHNVQGGSVKQTMGIADWVVPVAQRHPEMNLLAPYALTDMIRSGAGQRVAHPTEFMVMLGDATNAGCTGEFKRFTDAVADAKSGRVLLMAHGNHDSFLMGTLNYWQEKWREVDVSAFTGELVPVDHSWWTPATAAYGTGWRSLCHEAGDAASVPIHKIQWMAKYMQSLSARDVGLSVVHQRAEGEYLYFKGEVAPGTLLSRLGYALDGAWIRPKATQRGLVETYNSFLVQAINVGPSYRLVLVDTSACADLAASRLKGLIRPYAQNAGLQGCMGKRQLESIRKLVDQGRAHGRAFVFAGHFPLEDIAEGDRREFIALMENASGPSWHYISAHTHAPKSVLKTAGGGTEINLGSTTDWPMRAYQVQFGKAITAPAAIDALGHSYRGSERFSQGAELCRHVFAAEALAAWNPAMGDTYRSPGNAVSYASCEKSISIGSSDYPERLTRAMARIKERMADDAFRKQMLSIMAAASQDESSTFALIRPRIR